MELKDLSESQQELLQPLLRLKTDVSLDSLVVLRDVFQDISNSYNTFASSIKETEQKLLTCYNLVSSGSLTPQACEALLLVKGNIPNVSNVVMAATAEQSGVLKLMLTMLNLLNKINQEAVQFSTSLDKSVVDPISSFSNEYLKTFGKDEKRAFRTDILGFIPKLQEFKRSPNYSHSNIKKYIDNVLKSHKEMQDSLTYETQITQLVGREGNQMDPKLMSKAKDRSVRAKLSLSNHIQELFIAAPELKDIVNFKTADVDTLSQISRVSKRQSEASMRSGLVPTVAKKQETAFEFQNNFLLLEQRRLELFSSCLQHWLDNHVKFEKGVYAQLELLWKEVVKFSPTQDYQKFESIITGKTVQEDSNHARLWIMQEPGPIDKWIKTNKTKEAETPMVQSDQEEGKLEEYKIYKQIKNKECNETTTEVSKGNESDKVSPTLNTFDNIMVVQLLQSPVNTSQYKKRIENQEKESLTQSEEITSELDSSLTNESETLVQKSLQMKMEHKYIDSEDEEKGKTNNVEDNKNKELKTSEVGPGVRKVAEGNTKSECKIGQVEKQNEVKRVGLNKKEENEFTITSSEFTQSSENTFFSESVKTEDLSRGFKIDALMESKTESTSKTSESIESHLKITSEELKELEEKEDTDRIKFDNFVNYEKGEKGNPKVILEKTRKRLDEHMIKLFNRCREKNNSTTFEWMTEEVEDIVKRLEDYDTYPFTNKYQELENFKIKEKINVPMLRYSLFDRHMDEKQWTMFSLEVLMLIHQYLSGMVNHPKVSEPEGELRDFILANLGVLENTLVKFRNTIETYKSRCAISEFEYAILDVVMRPRDSFTNVTPTVLIHVMDIRYRILLLIDAFAKGDIVIHSEKLFVIKEFYKWMYRQLHVIHVGLVQKLSRVVNLIPEHSEDLPERWFKCLSSQKPTEELRHGFKFEEDEKVTKICNDILYELLKSIGIVNELKKFAENKFNRITNTESAEIIKGRLLDLMSKMVLVEDLDEHLKMNFVDKDKYEDSGNFEYLKEEDFIVDLEFFNDDDISVLAELRHDRMMCVKRCLPKTYKTKAGKFISRKAAEHDLYSNNSWNAYFTKRVDKVEMSKCWKMEEPVVLTICSCLHKYLSCEHMQLSNFPQHFQTILYSCSFMQTGILPNFNLLKENIKNNENNNYKNQIPILAQSILASSAYWFSLIAHKVTEEKSKNRETEENNYVEVISENKEEFYRKLRISGTDIKQRLYSMLDMKFKVTENVAKQLYILLQMPTNIHTLPSGLGDLNAYLLFDIQKYKEGGIYTPENLLPEYIYHDKNAVELVTLSNINEVSNSIKGQMKQMQMNRPYNKVHSFMSKVLNYQTPKTFTLDEEDEKWNYSLLTPSKKESKVSSILYLRFISANFKNELFKCICDYSKFIVPEGLFYILSLFVMLFRALYPRLSDHIPNLSLFESEDEREIYTMINIFRFIINKNAVQFTKECIERVKETNDPSLDNNSLVPLITDEIMQMIRYQCTTSTNVWNGFVQYGEFASLLCNCCILQLKNYYTNIKADAGVIMPELRKLMVLQREFDSSYIVRYPVQDEQIQEQRLLNCMFFTYKNSNHKYSGYIEFMKIIKNDLLKELDHKFVGITEMVDESIKTENWKLIGSTNSFTSGVVDLTTVLKFSLKASFDLSPPIEWLILPFTNACEAALKTYYNGITNIYRIKVLYDIHANLVQGEPPLPETEKTNENDESTVETKLNGKGGKQNEEETEKKIKKTLWKRLKHTLGGKAPKTITHANILSSLDNYAKLFKEKTVSEDLARMSNLEYLSNQLTKIPEELFGFYYSQIRQRDPEYQYLHRVIGTSVVSDVERFFYFEPHQILQMPHSKSFSAIILAFQRILRKDADQFIMDIITIVMWKIVFVDFRTQIFYNLYTPDIVEGYKIEKIIEKFPQTIFVFIEKLPEKYVQFAYNNFFEAFIKSVFYVIRNMKNKEHKFNRTNVKVLYHDVDTITRLLEKYSQDNLPLINNVKAYIRKLI